MKELMLLIPLGSALLLTGCAGTETEFQCNATTSDTCMTMEQANEKGHCCKVSDEAAFCLIQRPYISKTLLTRRISPRGSP